MIWDTGRTQGLPSLDCDISTDVVVIGLGGSGLAAILEARARGASVVGIDAGRIAGGAAGRNGGFLLAGTAHFYHDACATLGHDRALALYRLTMHELVRIAAETPQHVRITGSLRIAWSEEEVEDCRTQLAAMQADALPAEWYDGSEGSGLLIPTDGVYQPFERCHALASRAIEHGATLYENTAAIDVRGDRVATPHGVIRCGAVVVAVDGRLAAVLPELAPRVRTARLQMLSTAPLDEMRYTRPVYARYGYEYWQQLPDRRIAIGGFRDRFEQDEWTESREPSNDVQNALERFLRDELHIAAPVEHHWAASVGYTDDHVPVFDEVRPGVWAVGGYSGTGNVIGAMCGRAAAACATGGNSELTGLLG